VTSDSDVLMLSWPYLGKQDRRLRGTSCDLLRPGRQWGEGVGVGGHGRAAVWVQKLSV
jgi:hypothetical protein